MLVTREKKLIKTIDGGGSIKITLFDINEDLCNEWVKSFSDCGDVQVICSSFIEVGYHDAVVAPGNSYGIMTGGLDLVMRDFFGLGLQDAIQNYILSTNRKIPVGETLIVDFDKDKAQNPAHGAIIYAPTMEVPKIAADMDVISSTCAALCTAHENNINSVALSGMGTGVGGIDAKKGAKLMRIAYDTFKKMIDGREK